MLFSDVKDAGTGFIRSPHLYLSRADISRYGIFVLHSLCGAWGDSFCGEGYFSFGSTTSSSARRSAALIFGQMFSSPNRV